VWIKYLSTKFVLAVLSLVGGFYLAVTCNTSMGHWVSLVGIVLGAFNIANVAQDWIFASKPVEPPKE
jgi:hypothetical protein